MTAQSEVLLDPDDPFESALIEIAQIARRKRADYAVDGSPFSNFETTAFILGMPGWTREDSAFFNVLQKIARVRSLRINGRMTDTVNEALHDTYLDFATYSALLFAMHRETRAKAAILDAASE